MQHLNPPLSRVEDPREELRRLEAQRKEILDTIAVVHADMLARVQRAVSKFEREFWESDYHVGKLMDRLNVLRAQNTPLRTQIWDLQAKIKELDDAK